MTDIMTTRLIAKSTILTLSPVPSDQTSNAVTPAFSDSLRHAGFGLSNGNASPDTHDVRYWITPLDGADLVRLSLDNGRVEASRFFVRDGANRLIAGGPLTVRSSGEVP